MADSAQPLLQGYGEYWLRIGDRKLVLLMLSQPKSDGRVCSYRMWNAPTTASRIARDIMLLFISRR